VIESYCSLLQRTTNLSQSSTTQCELTTVFVETWYGRNENLIHVARTQWQHNKNGIKSFPYLPAPHIIPAFQMLIQSVDDPVLMKLVDYVRKTWINSTVYQITSWCVIGQPIRTNNDVEGWHRRLNKKACDQTPPFYETGSTSTCWDHSHADTDKVGVRGKAVSSPETTVPYQLNQHYATVGPVFQQGYHYNSTSKEMWAYQRSSFRPLNFRNILYCLYWHKYVMFL
jgi:hypothetical protein